MMEQMLFFDLCDDIDEVCDEGGCGWECQECGVDLLLNDNYKVCPRCGSCYELEWVRTYCDIPYGVKRSMYKQINHFKHILYTVQNREKKSVPRQVLERIEEHMEGLEVTLENIRSILKMMKEPVYYKHSVQIWCYLKGVTVFKCLNPDEEERILVLFTKVRYLYQQLHDNVRRNFLNYNFLAAKLLRLVGREDLSQLCKPLKHTALRNHNKIWKKLQELDADL